ncbi:type II toxin-antitoxin system VapC family toxin [Terriglobus sp. RCC_193]|uniref:type II toxin-antitoxin system VapC family toxin n=1 Tax=Terriglobus sp. RCC_193 TaxID=3239218 RepID=UPI0035249476
MYLLDTNIVSETVKDHGDTSAARFLRSVSHQYLYLSVITIEELLFGIRLLVQGPKRTRLEHWFKDRIIPTFADRIVEVDVRIADVCSTKLATARRKGKNPSLADALIAATATVHGLSIVTLNRKDFEPLDVPLVDL